MNQANPTAAFDATRTSVRPRRAQVEHAHIPSYLAISAAVSILLTIAVYAGIHWLAQGTYLKQIFFDRGWIPYFTTFLAFIAMAQLGGLLHHLRREARNLEAVAAVLERVDSIDVTTQTNVWDAIQERIGKRDHLGLVLNRVRRALNRVGSRGSSSDVAALLTEQAEIDRGIHSSSYALVKFIAWLLPVLGFIATVSGIGFSMAKFRGLFEQKGAEIQSLLGPITQDLGVAFDTTLLALIKVAIVMFLLYALQKKGTDLLNTFDQFCLDHILCKVQGGGIPEESIPKPFRDLVEILSRQAQSTEEKLEQALGRVTDRFIANERERWAAFTDSFRDAAREHQNAVRSICDGLTAETRKLTDALRGWEPQLQQALTGLVQGIREGEAQRVRQVAEALEQTGNRVNAALEKSAGSIIQAAEQVVASQGHVVSEFRQGTKITEESLAKLANELMTIGPQFRQSQQELLNDLRQVESNHVEEVDRVLESYAARVGAFLEGSVQQYGGVCDRIIDVQQKAMAELRGAIAKIAAILHASDELKTIQDSLHSNLQALSQSGQMEKSVSRLGDALDRLLPILIDLQKRRRMQVRIVDEVEGDGSPAAIKPETRI